jgi:LysM repeat protein
MRYAFILVLAVVFGAGCNPEAGSRADASACVAKGKKLSEQGDFAGAAVQYQSALLADPRQVEAHLELGLLLDEKLGDPIGAIYHYREYIHLAPQPEKRQVVEDFIERAKLTMASKLPQSGGVDPVELRRLQDEKAALMQENITLKNRVAELEKAAAEAPVAVAQPPPVPVPPVATQAVTQLPPVTARAQVTHVVQKRDTLYSLAQQYYGTKSAWTKIYDANRNTLSSPSQLKVGQTLVIP